MCQMVSIKTNFNTEIEVADIKKNVIENIIEAAGMCNRICQIILFGSVIDNRCTIDSDVDMLIVSDISRSKIRASRSALEAIREGEGNEKATKGVAAYHA